MSGYSGSVHSSKDEYEKHMRLGGITNKYMYTTKDDIQLEPEVVRNIYSQLTNPNDIQGVRSRYFVGGVSMKEILYKCVLLGRFNKTSETYVVGQTSLHSLIDVLHKKPLRSPVGYATQAIIENLISTTGLVCVTDFVKSTGKDQPLNAKETSIIEDYLEYRMDEGYPTFLHSAYPISALTDVFSKSFVEMLTHNYTELKQEDLYD